MNNIRNILVLISGLMAFELNAQETESSDKYPVHVGFYAPFGIQTGVRAGTSFHVRDWTSPSKRQGERIHRLAVTPKFGYFANSEVQQNYMLDAVLEYKWYRSTQKIIPKIGIGLGYILARQNVGGTVNLATGDISLEKRTLHFVTPTFNAGFEKNTNQLIGYYFSVFYGRKFTGQEVNSDFVGAEAGLTIHLKKQSN